MMGKLILGYMAFIGIFQLAACSNNPENPGLCALNCDSAMIGPSDGRFMAVGAGISYVCPLGQGGQPVTDPIMLKFRAVSGAEQVEEAAEKTVSGELADNITTPLSSISFEPIVNGSLSAQPEHNPNVEINGDVLTPAKYKGILTESNEFCTDTCGVASLEIVPLCPPAGQSSEVKVYAMSGALSSDEITVTVSTPESL